MKKRLYTMAMLVLALEGSQLKELRREEGQTLAEYALILALVALVVAGALFFLRDQITSLFSSIGSKL